MLKLFYLCKEKTKKLNLYNMADTFFEFEKIKMFFDIAQARAKIN